MDYEVWKEQLSFADKIMRLLIYRLLITSQDWISPGPIFYFLMTFTYIDNIDNS